MLLNALRSERTTFGLYTVMTLESRKFYCVLVENFQPIWGESLREALDAGELVYLIETGIKGVVIAGEGISVHPQLDKAA